MSTNFYLVRHAKKVKGIEDIAISSEGLLQAHVTASHFCKMPIKKSSVVHLKGLNKQHK
jgi:broad specificity phosphatase PhoE